MGVHRSPSRSATLTAYGYVAAQFALLALLLLWDPAPRWTVPGVVDGAAGAVALGGAVWLTWGIVALGRSASAVPLPVVHGRLKTGGPYRLSRHPIYTGLLALAWSAAVRAASPWSLLVAAALTVVLARKARFEEAALRDAYPGYADYAARTARLLPLGGLPGRVRRAARRADQRR